MDGINSYVSLTNSKFINGRKMRPRMPIYLESLSPINYKLDMLGGVVLITQNLSFGTRRLLGRGIRANYLSAGEQWKMTNYGYVCRINRVDLK